MASKRTESGEDEWLGVGLNPDEFHVHGLLGKGSFGEVYLVEKKSSKEIFAMKALDKTKI
jgi:protein-serine/threonine kinase